MKFVHCYQIKHSNPLPFWVKYNGFKLKADFNNFGVPTFLAAFFFFANQFSLNAAPFSVVFSYVSCYVTKEGLIYLI